MFYNLLFYYYYFLLFFLRNGFGMRLKNITIREQKWNTWQPIKIPPKRHPVPSKPPVTAHLLHIFFINNGSPFIVLLFSDKFFIFIFFLWGTVFCVLIGCRARQSVSSMLCPWKRMRSAKRTHFFDHDQIFDLIQ